MIIHGWSAGYSVGRYRITIPLLELARRGHKVLIQDEIQDRWPGKVVYNPDGLDPDRAPDVVLAHMVQHPAAIARLSRLAATRRTTVVVDLADDLWGTGHLTGIPTEVALMVRSMGLDPWDLLREITEQSLRAADAVITTTVRLSQVVGRMNPRVRVVPNYIPQASLQHRDVAAHDQKVVFGWGGGESHGDDFAEVAAPLASFLSTTADAETHLMGYRNGPFWRALPAGQRRWTPMRSPEVYLRSLDFCVGLAPSSPTDLNRSRSDVKALEYAARGIPTLAAQPGECAEFVEDGRTGLVISDPRDWRPALEKLMDPVTRSTMGLASFRKASQRTIEQNAHRWLKVFEEAR